MSDIRSVGFVVNPLAGSKKSSEWCREIADVMSREGFDFEIVETSQVGEVRDEVTKLRSRVSAVIAVGGDGTVHQVAQHLIGTDCFFGVLPNGSGNDFSRTLGMPPGIGGGLRRILKPSRVALYGVIEVVVREQNNPVEVTAWGVNTAGSGFDAAVAAMKTRIPILRGLPLYLASSLATLIVFESTEFRCAVDGVRRNFKGLMVAAGVGQYEGGGFRVFPSAVPWDGEIEVCEIAETNKLRALPLLIAAINGGHAGRPKVRMSKAREVRLLFDRPMTVHADGEVVSANADEVVFRVRPNVLKVLVPDQTTVI